MIINSLLDQDLYKISMMKVYLHRFNDIFARYEFRNRTKNIIFTQQMFDEIFKEIDHLCTLHFTEDELSFIKNIPWFGNSLGFIEILRMFKLHREYIKISLNEGQLSIIAEGPIWHVSMFEIFILAIVNEIYFRHTTWIPFREGIDSGMEFPSSLKEEGEKKLFKKIEMINAYPFPLTEFGTRRRYAGWWQEFVIFNLKTHVPTLTGTSNMYYAMKFGLKPLGTMAHEYICMHQGLDTNTVAMSQKVAFDNWMEEYQGELGIALSDTLGLDRFLKDFNKLYANAFTGCRHDSGDPIKWGEAIISHYEKFGIDPNSKTLMFSDSLDFQKAWNIYSHFRGKCKMGFGIGTHLTNDLGVEPLNIVYKLTEINGKPVAKLSDEKGKVFSNNSEYVKYLQEAIK